jgi:hypothetical protein
LDEAFARAVERVGEEAALPLFDGSAIWPAPASFVQAQPHERPRHCPANQEVLNTKG